MGVMQMGTEGLNEQQLQERKKEIARMAVTILERMAAKPLRDQLLEEAGYQRVWLGEKIGPNGQHEDIVQWVRRED